MRRTIIACVILIPVTMLATQKIFPAHLPPEPKINITRVDTLGPAVPGVGIPLRVYAPGGHPRRNCIALTSRDFAHWTVENGMRHTTRQLIANVTIVPIDPPVPDAMKNIPVAPYFDVVVPLPATLIPWQDGYFQTAALPTPCPNDGQDGSVENRMAAFNAPVQIVSPRR